MEPYYEPEFCVAVVEFVVGHKWWFIGGSVAVALLIFFV